MDEQQCKVIKEITRRWQNDTIMPLFEEEANTFEQDVKAYQEGRLEDIEPGLLEDAEYMAQVAIAAMLEEK
jgi:hypothetical protein